MALVRSNALLVSRSSAGNNKSLVDINATTYFVAKFGRDWVIPKTDEKPQDGRVTTGAYKNWRNNSDKSENV